MLYPDYAGWIQGLRDWLVVQEYTDPQISIFLSLGQIRMNRDLASYPMEAVVPIMTPAPGTPIDIMAEIPDFNRIRLIRYPGVGSLTVKAINEIIDLIENGDDSQVGTAVPKFYAIDAGKLYIYPLPPEAVEISVFYYISVPPISPTVPTNVFTTYHSDLLLYAASLEAAPYMTEDERIPVWQEKYEEGLNIYNIVSKRIKMGSTPLVRNFKAG